ncbi:type II CRISPR-associated endonuclease Cas1 [Levilactobacillus zymae]|uniref:CRISPR-associated endonuclease Cas1 n=1 Tax=Levilactobacillus zymae TaxID=267363 RepID=A0A1Y6JTE5_9LACO|nr:type II CRISPR-associated endonuclease Cas1 [Levilactobacillus zymae]SMS13216.1 CRISPR-associated protein Cas1 [Levilactobacillus zymae]
MGWRTVVVTQHAKISLMTGNLVVQTDTDRYHIPVRDVGVLLIQTVQAVITAAALVALAEVQAKVIFTGRDGQPICTTTGDYSNAQSAVTVQEQVAWPQERMMKLWTRIVASKLQNQIRVAQFVNAPIENLQQELDQLEFNDITNREAVVARRYFPLIFGDDFSRSDLTPINAALNYGYAILLSTVDQAIGVRGYLTCLGIHHARTDNAYNLGSDLMEPFRPIIDQWVSQQKIRDFTPDIKYGLVDLLNVAMTYNGQQTILRNAIPKYVGHCLDYLSGTVGTIQVEVEIPNEVSSHALNGTV